MSAEDNWSDWSDISYIDWDDLEKIYNQENKSSMDITGDTAYDEDAASVYSDSEMNSDHDETSEWSTDDSRWDMPLIQVHANIRHQRIERILQSEEWQSSDEINIKNVNIMTMEDLFPMSPISENGITVESDNSEDKVIDDTFQQQKEGNYELNCSDKVDEDNDPPCSVAGYQESTADCVEDNKTPSKRELRKKHQVYVNNQSSSSEIQSSDNEYKPRKSDLESSDIDISDEGSSDGFVQVKRKGRKRRNKMKKRNLFKENDQSKDNVSRINEFESARRTSLLEFRKRREVNRIHSKRLDCLLKSNGLRRQHVPAVGNCFFEAVARQTTEQITPLTLRQQVCEHIKQHKDYYNGFLNSDSVSLENEVDKLSQPNEWTNSLSDALPLAVANLLSVTVKIYSSNQDQAVIIVQPSLAQPTEKEELTLAYLCIPGVEHYDAVRQRVTGLSSESELDVCEESNNNVNSAGTTIESIEEPSIRTPKKSSKQHMSNDITPRKQAEYKSPKRKHLTRKRKSDPATWKRNIRKLKCNSGQEYESVTGQIIKARSMKAHNCSKCRFNCGTNISEDERLSIFKEYWNLKSYDRQRDFICSRVLERDSIGSPSKKKKQVARSFSFVVKGINTKVCKSFFTSTLGISRKTVETSLQKKKSYKSPISDKRGRHKSHIKTPTEDLDIVRTHIESFPVIESHYARKDTNRKFLGTDLSIRKMYDLYKVQCQTTGKRFVKENVYRQIFCSEYNISFHKPKKDQCLTCNDYNEKNQAGTLDDDTKSRYNEHQKRKMRGRQEKQEDKEKAKDDKTYQALTFDLEAVLSTPCSLVSQVYYKRKLSCYNLSLYSLGDNKGTCYLWNETEGERGSCEVATCLYKYVTSLPPYVRHLTLYSDNCMGQNRNKYVASALLYSVSTSRYLDTIDQKFLETGHTQMECDSMHSAIEYAKKKTSIYVPSQWDTVIRMARRKNPYIVIPMKYWDIFDFKTLQREQYKNVESNTKGEKVRWRDIKHLQFRKDTPDKIYYKYDFDDPFEEILCRPPTRGRQRLVENIHVKQKYDRRLSITEAKKTDLLSLCKSNVIPPDCVDFYHSLPATKSKKDRLPEPDIQEDDKDSD